MPAQAGIFLIVYNYVNPHHTITNIALVGGWQTKLTVSFEMY